MSEDFDFSKLGAYTTCDICGAKILRGIISVSQHWVETHGQQLMKNINKINSMPLDIEDKMDLVRKEVGLNQ